AIAYAHPNARVRLRNNRKIKEGCANCSTLFWIDTHEFPLGSIPPVAPALAISSAGFAPNATDEIPIKSVITAKMQMKCHVRRSCLFRNDFVKMSMEFGCVFASISFCELMVYKILGPCATQKTVRNSDIVFLCTAIDVTARTDAKRSPSARWRC